MPPIAALALLLVPQASAAPAARTHVELRESRAITLWFHVRALAEKKDAEPPEELAPAVEAARALGAALGGDFLAWGALEGMLPGCETAEDVAKTCERAPETLELRGGTKVALRERARELAAALVEVEPACTAWLDAARPRIAAGRALWETRVAPKERALFDYHLASLGMEDPGLAIPVYLVAEAPWPGAVTHRGEDGRGVSFVAVEPEPGTLFFETILHETTHALDVATDDRSALGELGRKLRAAGLGERDRALHDLPHGLMFVQSAESIRRVIDPAHVDYGIARKVYTRGGPALETLRAAWHDHLEGNLSEAQALDAIVASVRPAAR